MLLALAAAEEAIADAGLSSADLERGLLSFGVGLESFWRDALLMLGWGVTVLALATMRSKKTLS